MARVIISATEPLLYLSLGRISWFLNKLFSSSNFSFTIISNIKYENNRTFSFLKLINAKIFS